MLQQHRQRIYLKNICGKFLQLQQIFSKLERKWTKTFPLFHIFSEEIPICFWLESGIVVKKKNFDKSFEGLLLVGYLDRWRKIHFLQPGCGRLNKSKALTNGHRCIPTVIIDSHFLPLIIILKLFYPTIVLNPNKF